MKTAVLKSKTLRVGVSLVMLASLLLPLLVPASQAQGAVPASTTVDAGLARAVSANVNMQNSNMNMPSLAPASLSNMNTSTVYAAAGDAPATLAAGETANKPSLETKLLIQNLTKNADATTVDNAPGDVIHVTATIKNLGPVDLSNYAAKILAEKMLAMGSVINPGDGGLAKENKYMEFPPISQSKDCNCTAKFEFTVKLNENICTDMKDLVAGGMTVSIEDQLKKLNIGCAAAPVVTTPTAPVVTPVVSTEEAKVAPTHSKSGPELFFFFALAAMMGYAMWKKKAEVTE